MWRRRDKLRPRWPGRGLVSLRECACGLTQGGSQQDGWEGRLSLARTRREVQGVPSRQRQAEVGQKPEERVQFGQNLTYRVEEIN